MSSDFIILPFTTDTGENQMRRDRELMERARREKRVFFRLYNFKGRVITMGFLQNEEEAIFKERCLEDGVEVVRRPTGGGSVYHFRDITYSLVSPMDFPLAHGGVLKSYKRITLIFKRAFERVGLKIEEFRGKSQRGAFCFSSPAPYELMIGGKKFMGNAQVRRDGVLLQQGVIMFGSPEGVEKYIKGVDLEKFTYILKWIDISYHKMVDSIYGVWKEVLNGV